MEVVMEINANIINSFQKYDTELLDKLLLEEIAKNHKKIVVLDDDPTGVQTVHDVSVYTNWEKETLLEAFGEENGIFFILTNSRGLTAEQTEQIHKDISDAVWEAANYWGKDYIIISRGDSTLRGHYPLETRILKNEYENKEGKKIDGEILCPFFPEGGRYTIGDVHYVRYGEKLIPVNETEFAQDKTFGYSAKSLPDYIEEKTKGNYKAEDVISITIQELREMRIDEIEKKILSAENFEKIIVNAVAYEDLKVFCIALYRAMEKGKKYLFRTAAAFVKVFSGTKDKALLNKKEMLPSETKSGGIIVVGSHTEKTTQQLEKLKEIPGIEFLELEVSDINNNQRFLDIFDEYIRKEEELIRKGITVCCYTTRKLISADSDDKEEHLRLSVKISQAVQDLVGKLNETPAFVIAKGGITSSDIGVKALKVKKATVLGQIQPGVPVWKLGEESSFPGLPYVIFPGNVGNEDTLKRVVEMLV